MITNYPPDGLQRGASGDFESSSFPGSDRNQPAKPANPQSSAGEREDDPPLDLQERVSTPRGNGIVVQRWQGLIGVKLDETQDVIYFRGKDEIACLVPATQEHAAKEQ